MTGADMNFFSLAVRSARRWYIAGTALVALGTGAGSAMALRATNKHLEAIVTDSLPVSIRLGDSLVRAELTARIDSLVHQNQEDAKIIRAIGVDLCQTKSDAFILYTDLPCDRLTKNLRRGAVITSPHSPIP